MTDWIVFDYGGVLSLPQPDTDQAALAGLAGLPEAEFATGYWAYRAEYDRGDLSPVEYWSRVAGRSVDAGDAADLDDADVRGWTHLNDATFGVVEQLAARGQALALLSNTPESVATAMDRSGWAHLFPQRYYSCRVRMAKPDPEIYKHILAELGAAADEITFIDDRSENIDGAAQLGIRGIRFTDATALSGPLGL